MSWGDKRHIPSAEDIARMQQASCQVESIYLSQIEAIVAR